VRFQRTLALLGVGLLWLALGPAVLVAGAALLLVPRVRARLRPTWRVTAIVTASVLALAGLVVVAPDGWLPMPPGSGALVTQRYAGRPAVARPLDVAVPQNPHLAPAGRASQDGDAGASGTAPWPGPLGESPEVDTSWFGLERCRGAAIDSHDRLVALCDDRRGPVLRVIDPDSMNPVAGKQLAARGSAGGEAAGVCAGSHFYLDDADHVVVATADRRVLVVATADADGDPDLTTSASVDLTGQVPEDDCLVAVAPDWRGDVWWVSGRGRVGVVARDTGRVRVLDLGEAVTHGLAVDRTGVHLVTDEALYRLTLGASGRPTVAWRSTYDRGSGRKPGQLGQGSGTTPTLLPNGLVAITDNANPQLHVQFYDSRTGDLVCQQGVFGDDEGATEGSLASVGTGIVVVNTHGYAGPRSTALGLTTDGGIARVDVVGGDCSVRWTSEEVAPSSPPTVSLPAGLAYVWSKPHSWWGADAWYLSALDVRTGRTVFRVRTGLGALRNNDRSGVTLAPDGSAYVATVGGLVRVRDRS
jgi:hypothetical protein